MRSEDWLAAIVTVVFAAAFAAIIIVAIVQSQMTERAKFANGYEQVVERSESLTSPMWRKAR